MATPSTSTSSTALVMQSSFPSRSKDLTSCAPISILTVCLRFLSHQDQSLMAGANRYWHKAFIITLCSDQPNLVTRFATFLKDVFKEKLSSVQQEQFVDIARRPENIFSNLVQVREWSILQQERMLEVLQTFDRNDSDLEAALNPEISSSSLMQPRVRWPYFFNNTYRLKVIFKHITVVSNNMIERKRQGLYFGSGSDYIIEQSHGVLGECAAELAEHYHLRKAITVVDTITDENIKHGTLRAIVKVVARQANFDKAREIATRISDSERREAAYMCIAQQLAIYNFEGAIKMAKERPVHLQCNTLSDIVIKLAEKNYIERAFETTSAIVNSSSKGVALGTILAQSTDHLERVFEMVKSIPHDHRDEVLRCMVFSLSENQKFATAEKIAKSIVDLKKQGEAYAKIAMALALNDNAEAPTPLMYQAIETACKIIDKQLRCQTMKSLRRIENRCARTWEVKAAIILKLENLIKDLEQERV